MMITTYSADFFVRSAKWIPSGGAGLVSGRGNFRPGFSGRDWRSALAEPSFNKENALLQLSIVNHMPSLVSNATKNYRLCPQSSQPKDLEILSPGHHLTSP
ncbi:hypothetical protein Q1695_005107 [Nippostrongylus brasiliensis]|nr:hypothetical protein Q1695_005107 [Nippostrongylus brasiliensis]